MEAIEEEIEVELLALLVESMSLTKIYIAKVAGAVMLVRGLVGTLAPNMIAGGHGVQVYRRVSQEQMKSSCGRYA